MIFIIGLISFLICCIILIFEFCILYSRALIKIITIIIAIAILVSSIILSLCINSGEHLVTNKTSDNYEINGKISAISNDAGQITYYIWVKGNDGKYTQMSYDPSYNVSFNVIGDKQKQHLNECQKCVSTKINNYTEAFWFDPLKQKLVIDGDNNSEDDITVYVWEKTFDSIQVKPNKD